MPEASFLNFLSGLGSQALMQLGQIPNPHSGQREVNLPFARYSVQLLEILEQKTAGNRSKEEEEYLQAALTDLRRQLQKAESEAS
ncbi:MAG: DUF1844 domain-containing protein [Planctomycetota bacterium]